MTPVGQIADADFARKLMKVGQKKLDESGSEIELGQAINNATIFGEGILHTKRVQDVDFFHEPLVCAIDTLGNPIVAGDGNYITESDPFMQADDGSGR